MQVSKGILKVCIGVILGVVITLISQTIYYKFMMNKVSVNKIQLERIQKAILKYRSTCGEFPTQAIGLKALTNPRIDGCEKSTPLLEHIPLDAWDLPYEYFVKGEEFYIITKSASDFVLRSSSPSKAGDINRCQFLLW